MVSRLRIRHWCLRLDCRAAISLVKRNVIDSSHPCRAFSSIEGASHNQHKQDLTLRHPEALVVNALRLGDRERASSLLMKHVSNKGCPKAFDFAYVLEFCARAPDPLFAMETWRLIERNTIGMDCKCWIYIIKALSQGGYLTEALNLLQSLGKTDRAVIPMYNAYLNGCLQSGSLAQANKCLQLMDAHLTGKSEITYLELLKKMI